VRIKPGKNLIARMARKDKNESSIEIPGEFHNPFAELQIDSLAFRWLP
jgi:hypothetical protein